MRHALRTTERLLYFAGGILLLYWLAVAAQGCWSQTQLARRLDELGGSQRADAARREAGRSGLVGRITISRLSLSAMVVEGTSDARLERGVGHLAGTAFPGERGNVVLAAHRDTYFRRLKGVRRGDRIVLTTPDGTFRYRVDTTLVVPPSRTDLIAPTRRDELTLVTCYPFHWIGPAPDRFIVRSSGIGAPHRARRLAAHAHHSEPLALRRAAG